MKKKFLIIRNCFVLVMAVCLLFGSAPNVHAQEILTSPDSNIKAEIMSKKLAGIEVYEIKDDQGKLMGYFEPYTTDFTGLIEPRYSANVNWTLSPGDRAYGSNRFSLGAGAEISLAIAQSPKNCASYIGLFDCNTSTFGWISSSYTTNGWMGGRVVVGYDGLFSFAIKNVSNQTVSYSGKYFL